MKREKYHHGKGPGRATDGVTSVNRIFREELLLEQKSWRNCGRIQRDLGNCVPGRGNSMCKGPEAGVCSHLWVTTRSPGDWDGGKTRDEKGTWADQESRASWAFIRTLTLNKIEFLGILQAGVTWSNWCFNRIILAAVWRVNSRGQAGYSWDH